MTLKSCLKSMRLRTLPQSLSGIIVGVALASTVSPIRFIVVFFLALTAALLQVLSNLSNELGDTLRGTDTAQRQGIHYSIMDGEMTVPEMKRLIVYVALSCCLSGLAMIWFSFCSLSGSVPLAMVSSECGRFLASEPLAIAGTGFFAAAPIAMVKSVIARFLTPVPLAMVALGAAAIWAAMHYTLGRNPYGYRGLGDLFVFLFFGLVSVLGAAFVCSHSLNALWVIPASAVGLWSVAVLNVNNIRDMKTDAATRMTVALKLGLKRARTYQIILIVAGWVLMAVYSLLAPVYLVYVTIPLFILHLRGVMKGEGRRLDPMLPLLVMSTFATSLLFLLSILVFVFPLASCY